ncbi:hypothetical protein [Frankia sp. Cppng1_Ct_nod]|uniref:hypothetical protein n=1 Tax=Frankia sp. Cppng1_Ct_nod TaxID=2897162 RepID=UPI0010414811|nr:hypothetical protein [Frankia sp. Cppng1_Ct_nod]
MGAADVPAQSPQMAPLLFWFEHQPLLPGGTATITHAVIVIMMVECADAAGSMADSTRVR